MVSCLIEKDTQCYKELTVAFYSKDSVALVIFFWNVPS